MHFLRLICCRWLAVAAFMLPHAADCQDAAAPAILIHDGGMEREYHLALDEISVLKGEQRETEKLVAASVADLRDKVKAARQREKSARHPGVVELVAYEKDARRSNVTRRVITSKLVIQCVPGADVREVAAGLGIKLDAFPPYAPGMAIVEAATAEDALDVMPRLREHPKVVRADVLLARWRTKKWIPNDPQFGQQWHLRNTTQNGGALWIDANVTPVWDTYRGAGITIGIIDEGVQYTHPDIQPNYNTDIDYDFNGKDADPAPVDLSAESHGTACTGVAAARGNNGLGVCGVACESTVAGFRLIAAACTDQDEADAFALHNDVIHIKSNSWGCADDGETVDGPGVLAKAALQTGTTTGRAGRGTIYVFAGGNGYDFNDNSNYDGYANSIYTIAVGAVSDDGFQSYYSEPGANLRVCAPSNGGLHNEGIVTTDVTGDGGYNSASSGADDLTDRNYTKTFGGTSSACPVVSGICALMLQANPTLGWRDVQEILMRSARQVHHTDSDWITNAAGIHFNHKYGAGLVDAQAAVTLAQNWVNLGPQVTTQVAQTGLSVAIPDDNSTGISRTFNVTSANLRVEHVTVTININHTNRGDLEVVLTSPSGTVSRLAEQHPDPGDNYANWTFSSVRHWGETGAGNWTLKICDRNPGVTGTLTAATLNVYGSTVAGARVVPTLATLVAETNLPANSAADPGERVTYGIGLKNIGAANAVNLTATLLNVGGVTSTGSPLNYGSLTAGGGAVTRTFSFTTGGACGASSKLVLRLEDGGTFIGYATLQIPLGVKSVTTFTGGAITIRDRNTASPYPATLSASGIAGRVQCIRPTLTGFSHTYPRDVTVYLGGPDTLNVALFTDATTTPVTNSNYTFDDNAQTFFPRSGATVSGSYRPWDYGYFTTGSAAAFTGEPAADERGFTLGEFNGLNANGTWRLYVKDGYKGDSGTINSWKIEVTAVGCTDNIYLASQTVSGSEASGNIRVYVTRTGGTEGSATVQYATSPVTATAGVDYTPVSGTLTFAAGETSRWIDIPISNDATIEPDETLRVTLSSPGGNATLGSITTCTVTILNDDHTALETWRLTHFNSIADLGDGADLNDYDHDGIVNLLEYAFGLDPKQNSAGQLPQIQRVGGSYVMTFAQPAGVGGITYGAEWSPSLLPGSWTAIPDAPSGNQHTFSMPAGTAPRRFMRLKVTRP